MQQNARAMCVYWVDLPEKVKVYPLISVHFSLHSLKNLSGISQIPPHNHVILQI